MNRLDLKFLLLIAAALHWLAGTILFLIQILGLIHRPIFSPAPAAAE